MDVSGDLIVILGISDCFLDELGFLKDFTKSSKNHGFLKNLTVCFLVALGWVMRFWGNSVSSSSVIIVISMSAALQDDAQRILYEKVCLDVTKCVTKVQS